MNHSDIDKLEYSWTAKVSYNNGQVITIWHTAWPMSKRFIKEVLWIASDYPRYLIKTKL